MFPMEINSGWSPVVILVSFVVLKVFSEKIMNAGLGIKLCMLCGILPHMISVIGLSHNATMEKNSSFDLSFAAPILLGLLSLVGICVVLGTWLYKGDRAPASVAATETPFRFIYLGTEPGLSTLTPEATETPALLPTEGPTDENIIDLTEIVPSTPTAENGTLIPTQTVVNTVPVTITPTIPAVLSKVDDTYFELLYSGDWVSQSNVSGAHQNTLHISFTTGNQALFTFVGQQVILSYQAGPSLGSLNINLDSVDYILDQSNNETKILDWISPKLPLGPHTLLFEHLSGGSVNLDSITIPDLSPTPTATP
jgi:hypothetical protein